MHRISWSSFRQVFVLAGLPHSIGPASVARLQVVVAALTLSGCGGAAVIPSSIPPAPAPTVGAVATTAATPQAASPVPVGASRQSAAAGRTSTSPQATPAVSMTVGQDEAVDYPKALLDLPDEHTTFLPSPQGSGYLVFASSAIGPGQGGTVVLSTSDLRSFTWPAAGYSNQVMKPPVAFLRCDPTYATVFDENYAAPGSVLQDPTRPPGNLIMIYEAENHCPGATNQQPFYATVGLARSADGGKSWPGPSRNLLGDNDRYPILKLSAPEPAAPNNTPMGDAIPAAMVDGDVLYVPYHASPGPGVQSDGRLRIARGRLTQPGPDGRLSFQKWHTGAFDQPGIGGEDSPFMPVGACRGFETMADLSYNEALGRYLLVYVCASIPQKMGGWYFSTAGSLDGGDWTAPELVGGSQQELVSPCAKDAGGSFDGWYPSLVSPSVPAGHTASSGYVFFMKGCDLSTARQFMRRSFTVQGRIG